MNKLIKNSISLVSVVFIFVLAACSMIEKNDDDSDPTPNGIFIAPISESVTEQVNVSWDSPTTLIMSVALYEPVGNDLSVSIDQSNNLVKTYNSNNNLDFAELPSEALTFTTKTTSVASGEKASDPVEISVNMQFLEENTTYLLPIEITEVTGDIVRLNEAMNVKFYVLEVGNRP